MLTKEAAVAELKRRMQLDPLAYPKSWPSHNPAQVRAVKEVQRGDPMTIMTFGNGTGKTHLLVSMWSALMFGTKNPLFSQGVFKEWPKKWPKSARLCAPESLLGDEDVFQGLIRKLFPKGQYKQSKNHKNFYCSGMTNTGWSWDVMTYDQDAQQAAGETKGLLLYSEPPPRKLFNENLARLRSGGMTLMEMTPLNFAPWILDDYIDLKVLKNKDGKEIGRINHVVGDIWDNCEENPGGQLPREAIEIILSQYSDEEREMREKGVFGRLQGKIFKTYDSGIHEISSLSDLGEYHSSCFASGKYTLYFVTDPHDRKPFAIGWYAVFPNGDIVVMGEFPDETYPLFHKISSFTWTPEVYAKMIQATEMHGFGKPAAVRWIDPNFGQTTQFATKMTIRQTWFKWGQENNYPMNCGLPNDAITDGHLAVKYFLGDKEKGIRPKLYVMKSCKNHIFGFTHYAYKEEKSEIKALSEAPQLVYKDFMDLVRYLCIMNPRYIEPSVEERPALYTKPVYPGRK